MRNLIQALWAQVKLQHVSWLSDEKLAIHLTLSLDGWSNTRMESVYSFDVVFADRKVILYKAEELSVTTHSAENIAGNLYTCGL